MRSNRTFVFVFVILVALFVSSACSKNDGGGSPTQPTVTPANLSISYERVRIDWPQNIEVPPIAIFVPTSGDSRRCDTHLTNEENQMWACAGKVILFPGDYKVYMADPARGKTGVQGSSQVVERTVLDGRVLTHVKTTGDGAQYVMIRVHDDGTWTER
ncbi:MAG TPA: hypothetical protein VD770_00570 [Coxiellaceae bacterium]|nr:hypothetical protein [Coxiellaceae bacterium]